MSTSKSKKYENPGFDSTIYVTPQQITDTAHEFSKVAISLAEGYLAPHDVTRNVIYTNATFAIELYFKAFLVERVSAPFDMVIENGEIREAKFDDENRVTEWHSRLDVMPGCIGHNLLKLFNTLNDELRERVTQEVLKESSSIKSAEDLINFLDEIKDYFVDKRYQFQSFIYGVPHDSNSIHVLIPVLKAIGKALANPPDVQFKEFIQN